MATQAGISRKTVKWLRLSRTSFPGAKNINVDVSQIPVTVQVPVGIAANVCGVNANVLAQQGAAGAQCAANTTSKALDQLVQRQIKQNKNR